MTVMGSDSPGVMSGPVSPPAVGHAAGRLLSLDAFRGLVIVLMFLVNVAGTDPAFPSWFPHRGWADGQMGNGLADYVFPWFLFIVGVAIPFSMQSGRGRRLSPARKLAAAFRRGAIIYLLGTLLWCATIGYPPREPGATWSGPITWRVLLHWDILPLIGFGYVLGACLTIADGSGRLRVWSRVGFIVFVLVGKFVLLRKVSYPGTGSVVWEQSRSVQHLIRAELGWTGTLLTQGLPAAACVAMGSITGDILRTAGTDRAKRLGWICAVGLAAFGIAAALHATRLMPASKDFFTSSYVLGTCGMAAAVLGIMGWVVDVRRWTSLWALRVLGLNALAAYVGAELIWKVAMVRRHVALPADAGSGSSVMITALKAHLKSVCGDTMGAWLLVTAYIALYWTICRQLDRKRIYIKV